MLISLRRNRGFLITGMIVPTTGTVALLYRNGGSQSPDRWLKRSRNTHDLDHKWYYIIPGPFRIKIPLELIARNADEQNYEFEFRKRVQDKILHYILGDYREIDPEFTEFLDKQGYCVEEILENISKDGLLSVMEFYHKYQKIYDYFDDWILVKTNEEDTEITDIVVKKTSEKHIETCEW